MGTWNLHFIGIVNTPAINMDVQASLLEAIESSGQKARSGQLFHMVAVFFFFLESRTTSPGMTPPTVVWAHPHQSLIKKISYRPAYRPIFSIEGPSSSDDPNFCQMDIKLASTQFFIYSKF